MSGSTHARSGRRRATFRVRAPEGAEVFVAGTFNRWDATQKQLKYNAEEGVFTKTLLLEKGSYQYKFVVNGVWCIDPECPDWLRNEYGSLNSVINIS
jgi:1,4-alpha-glucan branching enzyme